MIETRDNDVDVVTIAKLSESATGSGEGQVPMNW